MRKTSLLLIVVFLVVLLASSSLPFPTPAVAAQFATTWVLPFPVGETWYVCQGYNGLVSHHHNLIHGLDLSIDPNSVRKGGRGCQDKAGDGRDIKDVSAGRTVIAPVTGEIVSYWGTEDFVCINLDDPDNGSVAVGHIGNRPAINTEVFAGQTVIGTVNKANTTAGDGGYAHIHIQAFSDRNCAGASSIPFDDAHLTRFQCAPDLPFNSDSSATNQWYGTGLARCPSMVVQQVWTADGEGTTKTTFDPGEEITYKLLMHNPTKSPITVDILWRVLGPPADAQLLYEKKRIKLNPGQSNHYIGSSLPIDAVAGNYRFYVIAQQNELISTQQQLFTLSEPDIPLFNAYVKALRFYESGNETLPRDKQVYAQRFAKDTTQYITWVLDLEFPAPGRRIDFEITEIWYQDKGTSSWEEIFRDVDASHVEANWTESWHEWGYGFGNPGNWDVGTYRVDIYVAGKQIASEQFEIY
jgi:hypothetical protein